MKDYDGGVDYEFLAQMGVTILKHQPWQIGLFYPDLKGKFIWYPKAGTLMFQPEVKNLTLESGTPIRIGASGDYIAGGDNPQWWDEDATERVWNEIIKKVNAQST